MTQRTGKATKHQIPEPRNTSAMAAHQVPQVTQRLPVNFHSSNSYMPAKHTLNQPELNRLVELFQSIMHNACRRIGVFIYFCVHMCILVCISVCVTERDAWLPIDVIIFHLQALISAWVQRYFYYSVCYILCVCLCMHMHMWMSVWYGEGGREREACMYLCAFVCGRVLHKIFSSLKKFQTLSRSFLVSWGVRKISFPTKIPAAKKRRRIKCHSVKGIGSSHWYKYNLSSHSGASFWINSVCGMTVYQPGRRRSHVLESGMGFRLIGKRWHDQLHQQKSLERVLKSAFVSAAPG